MELPKRGLPSIEVYREGIIVQLPFGHRICLGCMGLAIGKLQNAVYNHRPTNTNMQTAIDDAVRPLTEPHGDKKWGYRRLTPAICRVHLAV